MHRVVIQILSDNKDCEEAPDDEEDIADGVSDGVAYSREGAAERTLDSAKRGSTCACTGTAAECNSRIELKHLMAKP